MCLAGTAAVEKVDGTRVGRGGKQSHASHTAGGSVVGTPTWEGWQCLLKVTVGLPCV